MYRDFKKYDKLTLKLGLFLAAPHTWPASAFPALFGALYGYMFISGFCLWKSVLLFLACILFNSAANVFNDYFDYVKGTDSKEDNVEANDSVLVYNNLDPKKVRFLGYSFLALGGIFGCIAAIGVGYVPFVVGAVGGLAAYFYSGGKVPICYLPLGEITSGFVIGGLIPIGVVSCFDGQFHTELLLFDIPLMLAVALTNMSNHGCDIEKDIKANRKTLPILLGRPCTLILYRSLIVIWIISAAVVEYVLTGTSGLIVWFICLAIGSKFILNFAKLRLEPATRVIQLKGIVHCTYYVSGSMVLSLLIKILSTLFS